MPHSIAHQVSALPPVSWLFAALLSVNPIQHLLAPKTSTPTRTITAHVVRHQPHLAGAWLALPDPELDAKLLDLEALVCQLG